MFFKKEDNFLYFEMNTFLRLLSTFILTTFLFSCNTDDKEKELVKTQNLGLIVKYESKSFSYQLDRDTIFHELKNIGGAKGLVYVVHSKYNDSLCAMKRIDEEQLNKSLTSQEALPLDVKLPAGKYYLSVLAWGENFSFSDEAFNLLQQPYNEAVCQIDPRGQAYFGRGEVVVNEDEESSLSIDLEKMMSFFTFEFADDDKMPTEAADIRLSMNAKNLPQAFYLKSRATLTKQQETAYNIPRFSDDKIYNNRPATKAVAQYFLLDNSNLAESGAERGTISVVCQIIQNVEPRATSKIVNERFPEVVGRNHYRFVGNIYSAEPINEITE